MSYDCDYVRAMNNPPVLEVKKDAKEVRLVWLSVMCDNRYEMSFKKNADGEFRLYIPRFAYSNFQIKFYESDLEWAADEGNWDEVFKMMNTGVGLVESVKSR